MLIYVALYWGKLRNNAPLFSGTGKNTVVGKFDCGTVVPCTGIVLRNISLGTTSLFGDATFACNNCKGSASGACSPDSCFGVKGGVALRAPL